jgi:hypothetical protein
MSKTKLTIRYLLAALVILAMALSACNVGRPTEVLEEGGNVIPTPVEGTDVGEGASSQAAGTPEETFSRYMTASLGSLVALHQQRIELRQRYQNPSQTLEDLGGLVTEIDVVDDRTEVKKVNENSTNATANVDVDVRVGYADGDRQTFTCNYAVTLQQAENEDEEEVWYVINPAEFPLFVSCRLK